MSRGGKRAGAGRPKQHQTPTKVVRLPVDAIASVKRFLETKAQFKLPLFSSKVAAGFPIPAEDHIEEHVDLNELIKHPAETFLVRVSGDSMIEAGIQDGDILVVDRSIPPTQDKVVIAVMQGQLTVKRLHKKDNKLFLIPANAEFSPIEVKEEDSIHIWGVVTKVIHDMQ